MVRPKKIKLIKKLNKKQLNKKIRTLEEDNAVLYKLHFIRHLYNKKSIEEAAELEEISISTAYNWLNRWNEDGIEGLRTKPRSGRPGKLTPQDKEILDAKFFETKYLTTEKAHKIIKDTCNEDFTFKHVRTILHQLGYNYRTPNTKYFESDPKLRKKFKDEVKELDPDKQIIGFLDQTYCDKNYPPKVLRKANDTTPIITNGIPTHQTATGFQPINGIAHLDFPENSRSHNMMFFVGELRIKNLENKDLIPLINAAMYDNSVDYNTLLAEYNINSLGDENFSNKLKKLGKSVGYKNTFRNRVTSFIYKNNEDKKIKIEEMTRFKLIENLEAMNLDKLLKDEKEIVIILDNYKPHHNDQFIKFCQLLKIRLIYLPPYTPQYNPIEQVWKSIKRLIYDP